MERIEGTHSSQGDSPSMARLWAASGLMASSVIGFCLSVVLPLVGRHLLKIIRGRDLQSVAAKMILPELLLLVAIGGVACALLLGSAGLLLFKLRVTRTANSDHQNSAKSTPNFLSARFTLSIVVLMITSFAVLTFHAAGRSFTYDEILAMAYDVKTPWSIGLRPRAMINHYSGTVLARIGVFLVGDSERAARFGSVAFAVLGISSVCWAGWRWAKTWYGTVWPATFLCLHGFVLTYAIQVRGYSPLMWASLLLSLIIAVVLERESPLFFKPSNSLWVTGVVSLLALTMGLAHLFGLIYLGFMSLLMHLYAWTGWRYLGPDRYRPEKCYGEYPKPTLWPDPRIVTICAVMSVATAISLLAWAPNFPWLFYYKSKDFSGAAVASTLWREMPFLTVGNADALSGYLMFLLLIPGVFLAWRNFPVLRILAITAGAPLLGLVLTALIYRPTFLGARFFACALPLSAVCCAVALRSDWPRFRGGQVLLPWIAIALTIFALYPGTMSFLRDNRGYREQALELISHLNETGDVRSRVLLLGENDQIRIMSYYLPADRYLCLSTLQEWEWRQQRGIPDLVASLGNSPSSLVKLLPEAWRGTAIPEALTPTNFPQDGIVLWKAPLLRFAEETYASDPH